MSHMTHPHLFKVTFLVTLLIQTYYELDILFAKVGNVIGRSEHAESFRRDNLGGLGASEGEDLVLDDPVEVAIFYLFEVFVFVCVEDGWIAWRFRGSGNGSAVSVASAALFRGRRRRVAKLEETKLARLVETLETIVDGQIVRADDGRCVVEWREGMKPGEWRWPCTVICAMMDATTATAAATATAAPQRRRRTIRQRLSQTQLRRHGCITKSSFHLPQHLTPTTALQSKLLTKPKIRFLQRPSQIQHAPSTYQIRGIRPRLSLGTAVVTNDAILILWTGQFGIELGAEAVELAEVEGAKVEEEVPVDEFVVDGEVVDGLVLDVLIGLG